MSFTPGSFVTNPNPVFNTEKYVKLYQCGQMELVEFSHCAVHPASLRELFSKIQRSWSSQPY